MSLAEPRQSKLTVVDNSQKFLNRLNELPKKEDVQKNTLANNSDYLPISFVENTLDEMFFGLWSTENFTYQVVANEIIGSIDLKVYHAPSDMWITRTGCASTPIKFDQGAAVTELEKKKKTALVTDFPHMKAECLKNAAKSLGKIFGRDLNRKYQDKYDPMSPIRPTSSLDKKE